LAGLLPIEKGKVRELTTTRQSSREWKSQAMKLHMKKEITMKVTHFLAGLSLSVLLSACAAFNSAGDVAQGRQALLEGKYQLALDYFWAADQTDPHYMYGAELREGVLSFLGRAQYLTGNYAQARQTLEKDLSHHRSDNVARLYLGLTQYRLGDKEAALMNIQRGMQGIYNWLNYINDSFRFSFGKDWDPEGTIRAGIKSDLAMISSGKINWAQLIADAEGLGIGIEQEEDYYRIQDLRS
jgi:tetratricopeptide (TPR) repeat protein